MTPAALPEQVAAFRLALREYEAERTLVARLDTLERLGYAPEDTTRATVRVGLARATQRTDLAIGALLSEIGDLLPRSPLLSGMAANTHHVAVGPAVNEYRAYDNIGPSKS